MNKNHVEKKKLPLYCDKVSITLETKNDLVLNNAYEAIIDLLNEKYGQLIKVEAGI